VILGWSSVAAVYGVDHVKRSREIASSSAESGRVAVGVPTEQGWIEIVK
jgi:hypothetical protein